MTPEQAQKLNELNAYCKTRNQRWKQHYDTSHTVFLATHFDKGTSTIWNPQDCAVNLIFAEKADLGSLECTHERISSLKDFLRAGEIEFALGYDLGKHQAFHFVEEDFCDKHDIWFLGDIHGDLLGLRSAIAFINSNSHKTPVYVFTGDLFDRNEYSLQVLLDVIELIRKYPGRVLWVTGNHDDAISVDLEKTFDKFKSSFTPQEYTAYLNQVDDAILNCFMNEIIDLIKKLPVALLMPNGLLVVHGGIPSRPERKVTNIWESVNKESFFAFVEEHRHEFCCNRFAGDPLGATKIAPDFSWAELSNFSAFLGKNYGKPVKALLRGHDHCDLNRHQWSKMTPEQQSKLPAESRDLQVLTMTTMALLYDNEPSLRGFAQKPYSYPSIAYYQSDNAVPHCYSIVMDNSKGDVDHYYDLIWGKHCAETCQRLAKRLEWLNKKLQEAMEEQQTAQKNMVNAGKEEKTRQEEVDNCFKKGRDKYSEKEELSKQLQGKTQEKNTLINELSKLEEQKRKCEKNLNELKTMRIEYNQKLKTAQENLHEKRNDLARLKRAANEQEQQKAQKDMESAEKIEKDCQKKLEQCLQSERATQCKMQDLSKQLQDKAQKVKALSSELDGLKQTIDTYGDELKKLKTQYEECKQKLETAQKNLRAKQEIFAQCDSDVKNFEKRISECNNFQNHYVSN